MPAPTQQELQRLFNDDLADDVHFTETVCSWPSLRLLDHLYASEPKTTGEIARTLNMDMREVHDLLDDLKQRDIVAENEDGWRTTTTQITVELIGDDGLQINHEVTPATIDQTGNQEPEARAPSSTDSTTTQDDKTTPAATPTTEPRASDPRETTPDTSSDEGGILTRILLQLKRRL